MSNAVTVLPAKPSGRSKVTNSRLTGKITARGLMVEGDARTAWARRYKDVVCLLIDDAGGLDSLSELKLGLIRRAATLMLLSERLEARLAAGEEIDIDLLSRLSGQLRRLAETIGLDRVSRNRVPTLHEIAARHRAEKAAGASGARAPTQVAGDED